MQCNLFTSRLYYIKRPILCSKRVCLLKTRVYAIKKTNYKTERSKVCEWFKKKYLGKDVYFRV